MRFLFDTHLLIWAVDEDLDARLPGAAAAIIDDQANELFFSAASIWEIAIKSGRGRSDFQLDPMLMRRSLRSHGWIELPVTGEHASAIGRLPSHHRDPFDRLLAAQAMVEGFVWLTSDAAVAQYGAFVRRV
jgi:PIN domain nuclease of toxin-antitoxin system